MKSHRCDAPLTRGYRMTINLGQYLNVRAILSDPRRADEYASHQATLDAFHSHIRLEAAQLASESVALGTGVHDREMIAVEHDQPRARAEDGYAGRSGDAFPLFVNARKTAQWDGQALAFDAQGHRGGLSSRDHEAIESGEVGRDTHLTHARAQTFQNATMRLKVPL
jgi:hypothetical protein